MGLPRDQEYAARWLGRAGRVSLRMAESRGIPRSVLDAVVVAGLATRTDDGPDPIYEPIRRGATRTTPVLTTGPPRPEAPLPPRAIEHRIVDLLADGAPRAAGEIAATLGQGTTWIAQRELSRDVQRVLPGLVARHHLHRLSFGREGQHRYDEKFVAAGSVQPVCLRCFRAHWSVDAAPPQTTGNAVVLCSLCRGRTNGGAYVPIAEVADRAHP